MNTEIDAVPEISPSRTITTLFQIRSRLPNALRDTVQSGRQLIPAQQTAHETSSPLPTTITAVDRLIAGGLPRGRLVELTGKRSSGRFSTLLAALAAATGSGDAAVLIDLGDHLDPRSALEAGVDLARLLWIRPSNLRQALISTELVLQTGFPLVALDLGTPPVRGGRGAEAHWLRLARTAEERQAALFVSSPYRVSSTAATAVLTAEKGRPIWLRTGRSPRMLDGLDSRFLLKKSRLAAKSGDSTFRFTTVESKLFTSPRRQPETKIPDSGPAVAAV